MHRQGDNFQSGKFKCNITSFNVGQYGINEMNKHVAYTALCRPEDPCWTRSLFGRNPLHTREPISDLVKSWSRRRNTKLSVVAVNYPNRVDVKPTDRGIL